MRPPNPSVTASSPILIAGITPAPSIVRRHLAGPDVCQHGIPSVRCRGGMGGRGGDGRGEGSPQVLFCREAGGGGGRVGLDGGGERGRARRMPALGLCPPLSSLTHSPLVAGASTFRTTTSRERCQPPWGKSCSGGGGQWGVPTPCRCRQTLWGGEVGRQTASASGAHTSMLSAMLTSLTWALASSPLLAWAAIV